MRCPVTWRNPWVGPEEWWWPCGDFAYWEDSEPDTSEPHGASFMYRDGAEQVREYPAAVPTIVHRDVP